MTDFDVKHLLTIQKNIENISCLLLHQPDLAIDRRIDLFGIYIGFIDGSLLALMDWIESPKKMKYERFQQLIRDAQNVRFDYNHRPGAKGEPEQQWINWMNNEYQLIRYEFEKSVDDYLYLSIDKSKAHFYMDDRPFGVSVYEAFPNFNDDIKNASKCFALDQHNAGLYYAIGVLEQCIREFGRKVGYKQYKNMDWGDLNGRISRQMQSWKPTTNVEKGIQMRLTGLLSHYWRLNKYRINIAHRKLNYRSDEALLIYNIIKDTVIDFVTVSKLRIPASLKTLAN